MATEGDSMPTSEVAKTTNNVKLQVHGEIFIGTGVDSDWALCPFKLIHNCCSGTLATQKLGILVVLCVTLKAITDCIYAPVVHKINEHL
jgi:hypothetical protein